MNLILKGFTNDTFLFENSKETFTIRLTAHFISIKLK